MMHGQKNIKAACVHNPTPFGNVLQGMTLCNVFLKSTVFSKHSDKETLPNKQGCFNIWSLGFTFEGLV
jgi:hypothetical protein